MESNNDFKTPSRYGVKSKAGIIIGFIAGVAGFLVLFKIIILDNTPPEDELAPGAVVLASLFAGVLLAQVGRLVQRYFEKRTNPNA